MQDRGQDRGFEFHTEHFINTKEFWEELAHDNYFRISEGFYRPLEKVNILAISCLNEI